MQFLFSRLQVKRPTCTTLRTSATLPADLIPVVSQNSLIIELFVSVGKIGEAWRRRKRSAKLRQAISCIGVEEKSKILLWRAGKHHFNEFEFDIFIVSLQPLYLLFTTLEFFKIFQVIWVLLSGSGVLLSSTWVLHSRARKSTPAHASERQSTPMHASARQCMPVHARARQSTVEHSREQLSTWSCYNIYFSC